MGQLEDPPNSTLAVERRALSLAAQGPGVTWRYNQGFDDLFALRECWGLPQSFHSIQLTSQAAKLRVAFCEKWQLAGGHWPGRADDF